MKKQHIIFTDLDGTLLDHHSYSFAPVVSILDKLQQEGIPVIPNTSKTFAELVEIRGALKLTTPFIVENGAAIYIPTHFFPQQPIGTIEKSGYWLKEFSPRVEHWVGVLDTLQAAFSEEFEHFSRMSVKRISEVTGLSEHDAELAATREYGEPVNWLGDQASKTLFIHALEEAGATPLQGGRFLHVSGYSDKGQALTWLLNEYQKQHPDKQCDSIALGDGQNDVAMLEVASLAIRILSPTTPPPELKRTNKVITSHNFGPTGWAECIEAILFKQ
ncbi:HAD-IIB family hydrolase [Paraglaciecola aquimarina]|uniref:HAD-IIB family hydrolase n=1 Tax=Paraglaciecola aquimarina TaxID=1235557 RepID=A0ABU3SYR4_9ALTE|nr:HAD-IIB family hydrolase [Paraglaciecola aquimarina]MDU0355151.1 HAD-IIB family hydrolase [Paraglaciecola aquimarina]